jgi:hypothetical protein
MFVKHGVVHKNDHDFNKSTNSDHKLHFNNGELTKVYNNRHSNDYSSTQDKVTGVFMQLFIMYRQCQIYWHQFIRF